jgi:alpha/beta superfamily hydrolase
MYDFAFLAPCPASGLIVHGTRGNVVPGPMCRSWWTPHRPEGHQDHLQQIDGANHFFDKHEASVVETVRDHVSNMMSKPARRR